MKCPNCGKQTTFKDNPFRPFCSERCQMADLGKWVTEGYRIPATTPPDSEFESAATTQPLPAPEDD
ncbi:MAG: DNA gyrase inhibitor YacG [Acidobacteria bacterium]|nr:DNA gyrase inhibitor YacG [Acidobacteriota bacterium]